MRAGKTSAPPGAAGRQPRLLAAGLTLVIALAAAPAHAQSLAFEQVLAQAAAADAALRIARLELERAQLEIDRVESGLGWFANGSLGIGRETNIFGLPSDRIGASAGFERRLPSGGTVGLGVDAAREESDFTLSPFLPNPADSVRADASYRVPLRQGKGGVGYYEGLEAAAAGVAAARAELRSARDALAQQASQLFYAAAFTYERLQNAEAAVARAQRLRRFVRRNLELGISEEQDRLQAEAQLRARIAESRALRVQWENQHIALNRLMERPWDSRWTPAVVDEPSAELPPLPALVARALSASPDLERERARLRAAESVIARTRDSVQDQVDLVFSVGGRRLSGDIPAGEVSESAAIASVRLEYRAALDNRGAAAELSQAFLSRDIARERLDAIETSLRYNVASLAAEIEALESALAQALARQRAEAAKLEEATERHESGRATTADLIQFENDYEAAALAAEQQAIELARRIRELERVTGRLWARVDAPADTTQAPR